MREFINTKKKYDYGKETKTKHDVAAMKSF